MLGGQGQVVWGKGKAGVGCVELSRTRGRLRGAGQDSNVFADFGVHNCLLSLDLPTSLVESV